MGIFQHSYILVQPINLFLFFQSLTNVKRVFHIDYHQSNFQSKKRQLPAGILI